MPGATAAQSTLVETLWPRSVSLRGAVRDGAVILAASLVLALSARLQVPFWPVPVTMQSFAVLVIAMACGRRLGVAAVGFYLLEGALGLPVFAGGGGLAYFSGPTAGYLLGFVLAAWLMGGLAERGWDRTAARALLAMTLGTALIFLCGLSWLGAFLWRAGDGGLYATLQAGLLPFVPGAVLKIVLAAAVLPGVWRLLGNRR